MKNSLSSMLIYIIIFFAIIAFGIYLYIQQPKFGSIPKGEYLAKMKKSPNYSNRSFVNLIDTPQFKEGTTITSATLGFILSKKSVQFPKSLFLQ